MSPGSALLLKALLSGGGRCCMLSCRLVKERYVKLKARLFIAGILAALPVLVAVPQAYAEEICVHQAPSPHIILPEEICIDAPSPHAPLP